MSRLQAQLQRLFLMPDATLMDAQGMVRAMVLELAAPADWPTLSGIWQGVQTDLALPPPAIAVNGVDGYQLWFSLQQPLPWSQAHAFLHALRLRYLPDSNGPRIGLLPACEETGNARHASLAPQLQPGADEHWSAFVAPDLAPVFADTPWLDMPPGLDGQAELLSRMACIPPAALQTALARLQPACPPDNTGAPSLASSPQAAPHLLQTGLRQTDPQRFLLDVMNNDTVPLALRIEAAKALLSDRSSH